MPNIQRTTTGNAGPIERRFKVAGTLESGIAVSKSGLSSAVGHFIVVGAQPSVNVIDLCMEGTGEIRTFRADRLEEVQEEVEES